jgi:hypothetical protein
MCGRGELSKADTGCQILDPADAARYRNLDSRFRGNDFIAHMAIGVEPGRWLSDRFRPLPAIALAQARGVGGFRD